MSFKRDGDDVDLLRSLKHRRVCELLSNYIPDDEAMLLKNGRLTCLICSHRPIFDTISMLATHRKGKKHVNELSKHLLHKRESELKKLKAEQVNFLRTGMVKEPVRHGSMPQSQQSNKLLVSQVPYKSHRLGLQRKATLDIHIRDPDGKEDSLIRECIELKLDFFKEKSVSKESDIPGVVPKNSQLPSASAQVRRYLKELWKKKPLEKSVERCRENYGLTGPPLPTVQDSSIELRIESSVCTEDQRNAEVDLAKKRQAEQEIKLRMSGWIKDVDGNWIQDPDVEFDSDEEPPKFPD